MGRLLLAVALVGAVGGGVAAVGSAVTGRRSLARVGEAGLAVAAVASVAATVVLGRAFAVGDYSLVAVADHSREALGTWDRVMGLWGGMAGSLLLFTAATSTFAAIGLGRRSHPVAVAVSCLVVGTLVAVGRAFADPFATLQIPALDGVGLTPILEHWAMRVHPPIVYAGMTVLVVPAARTLGALADRRLDDGWWRGVHAWLVASWGLLGAGMLLGALWAYVELGWGGYWAWDPVENAALLPWLGVTVALHTGPGQRPRVAGPVVVAPFLLAVLGATLTRSGATTSVHAFAEARDIGLALTVLLLVLAVVTLALVARAARAVGGRVRPSDSAQLGARVVVGAVLAVVLLGTLYPLLRGWLGGDRLAVEGRFFSGSVAPLVVVGLVALIGRGSWPSPWSSVVAVVASVALVVAGWREAFPVLLAALAAAALVASARTLVRTRRPAELAHAGLALLLVGVAGTATGAQVAAPVAIGESIDVAGHEVALTSIGTEPGPTSTSTAVVASLSVDGHARTAALVAHPDRGVLLAESTLRSTPAVDVQVILRNATDDVALLVVNVSPLQQLVWWGAAVMVAGGVASVAVGGQPSSRRPRRSRWDSSSDPIVDAGRSGGGGSPAAPPVTVGDELA